MDYKKNILFEEVDKILLIKVLKRTKYKAALKSRYDDEIFITFIVCK